MSAASGKSSRVIVRTALLSASEEPDVATMTGSTTTFSAWWSRSAAATVSIWSSPTITPIFTAAGRMSVNTESICSRTTAGSTGAMSCTPVVFCAVMPATTHMPYTSFASIAFRSAAMPAPPDESVVAIVSAAGSVCGSAVCCA